jgi:hypothetical protein
MGQPNIAMGVLYEPPVPHRTAYRSEKSHIAAHIRELLLIASVRDGITHACRLS